MTTLLVFVTFLTAVYCLPLPLSPDVLRPIRIVLRDEMNLSGLLTEAREEGTPSQRFSYYIIRHIQDTLDREFGEGRKVVSKDSPAFAASNVRLEAEQEVAARENPPVVERVRTGEKIFYEAGQTAVSETAEKGTADSLELEISSASPQVRVVNNAENIVKISPVLSSDTTNNPLAEFTITESPGGQPTMNSLPDVAPSIEAESLDVVTGTTAGSTQDLQLEATQNAGNNKEILEAGRSNGASPRIETTATTDEVTTSPAELIPSDNNKLTSEITTKNFQPQDATPSSETLVESTSGDAATEGDMLPTGNRTTSGFKGSPVKEEIPRIELGLEESLKMPLHDENRTLDEADNVHTPAASITTEMDQNQLKDESESGPTLELILVSADKMSVATSGQPANKPNFFQPVEKVVLIKEEPDAVQAPDSKLSSQLVANVPQTAIAQKRTESTEIQQSKTDALKVSTELGDAVIVMQSRELADNQQLVHSALVKQVDIAVTVVAPSADKSEESDEIHILQTSSLKSTAELDISEPVGLTVTQSEELMENQVPKTSQSEVKQEEKIEEKLEPHQEQTIVELSEKTASSDDSQNAKAVPPIEIVELHSDYADYYEGSEEGDSVISHGDFGLKINASTIKPVVVEDYEEVEETTPLPERLGEDPPAFYDQDLRASRTIHGGRLRVENSIPILSDSKHKFAYVVDDTGVRKYRVEEKTPEGYIVGEYGVLNHESGHLRGVKYAAHGSAHPRLIYEALRKFLSL